MKSLTVLQTREMMYYICDRVIAAKQRLTALDGIIGDGDHGIGMSRGMTRAREALTVTNRETANDRARSDSEEDSDQMTVFVPKTINDIFYCMGRNMISTMGGSSGVIFGTMFMGAVKGLAPVDKLDGRTLTVMMRNALTEIQKRGKAAAGEKTMVDALEPAVLAMEAALYGEPAGNCPDLPVLLKAGADAARAGAEATKDMISKHGHSKTLGERALGHADPGAVSVEIIFRAMEEYCGSC